MLRHRRLNPASITVTTLAVLAVASCGGAESRKARHLEKGQAFLAAENFGKARVEFQNALQIAPKDPQARLDMGIAAEKLGNPREAAQFYQSVIDVSPDNDDARARLARLYLFSGAADRALETVAPGLEKHPDDAELLTMRAAVRVQQKNLVEARSDAERAARLAPTNEDAVSVLAGVYSAEGEKDKAQALLEQSILNIPATIDLRVVLAQLYQQQARSADAESLLLKVIELKPRDKSSRVRLAQFYAQSNQNDAAESTLRKAIASMPAERDLKLSLVEFLAARRSRDIAGKELDAMIAAAPNDSELKFALAKFYEEGGQPAKAEAVLRSIIDKERLNAPGLTARDRLAAMRLQEGDTAGALVLANEVLAASPRDDDALLIRGTISLAEKDPRDAIADLRAVLRDQPNAVGALRSLARAHLANGEPALAEEIMRHAIEANPKNPALELDFAQLLAQTGKTEKAKLILAEQIEQNPGNVEALNAEFRIGMATKDAVTAKAAADALVAARPKFAAGYLYQGLIAEADHRTEEALRFYSQAVELQPDAMEPVEAEVRLLVHTKRTSEAIKRLDELAARFPDASFALNLKGNLLAADGHAAEARETFKMAIARTPKWWPPYRGLASSELAAKDPAAAIATLRNAKSIVDEPDALAAELASLLERQGKPDEAIAEYEEILHRSPQSDMAANNLAMLLATYKKDSASLDRAKDLSARFANSANPSFLDTYGWVLFKRGEATASVPVLTRVLGIVPDAVVVRYHLGMAQAQAGDNSDARDNLARAVNSGNQFSGLDEARATLARLAKMPATAPVPKT